MTRLGKETLACLVIDDPLLRPNYGCLNFETLLREMKEHRFFTEIAFIPWNWNRCDDRTVRLFADNPDYFGICIHGCNHTGNEFGAGTYEALRELSSTAMQRMEMFKLRTGLDYDPVMVFPQGRFCKAAMRALKDEGYLAAFNSCIQPRDGDQANVVDFEGKTVDFDVFPLFVRRYSHNRKAIMNDVAVGRPIILVEHHKIFCKGNRPITEVVDWINGLGNVRWTSLSEIAAQYSSHAASSFERDPRLKNTPRRGEWHFDLKVALRRAMSEVRDNYIESNKYLAQPYMRIREAARKAKSDRDH